MSFLTATDAAGLPVLIRDMWPYDCLPKDPTSRVTCKAWEAVPRDGVELADWLLVVPRKHKQDKTRPFQVIHALTDDDRVKYEVGLRLQGIVQECDINPVGNWDGTAFGAQNAIQRLVLHGRGFDTQWNQTLRQLNKLITVVTRLAEPRHDLHLLPESVDTVLALQRRVFDRVQRRGPHATNGELDPSILKHHADTIRRMATQWALGAPVAIGAMREGALRRTNHIVIRPGNFVDVLATVEVVQKHRGTRVFFKLDRVVQIDDSEDIFPDMGPGNSNTDDDDEEIIEANAESIFAADSGT